MTDTAPETEFVPIAEAEIEMTAGELRAALAAQPRRTDMLSDQKNCLGRLLLDRDDRACAFPPAERVIRLPEVEAILAEAISAAYRKGQEDMRKRAAHVSEPVSVVAARFVRTLEIKESPDADAVRAALKEGGADAAG